MHLWKDNILSKVTQQYDSRKVVHRSEKSWLVGELVTSEITLIILPYRIDILVRKIMMEKDRKKIKNIWRFAIQVISLVLFLAILLPPVVLAFIALSVGKDIKMMIGRLCYWMIGKLCNSDSAPQVS
jgi:hypothetical protein